MTGLKHHGLTRAEGPIVVARKTETAGYGELVRIHAPDGRIKSGRVVETSERAVAIQLFSDNAGLSLEGTSVEYLERPLELRVGPDILGRVFDGLGMPSDGYPEILSSDLRDINGSPINPAGTRFLTLVAAPTSLSKTGAYAAPNTPLGMRRALGRLYGIKFHLNLHTSKDRRPC
jgi:vacuolar-type H+-ATPase subunit B/Vma2